MALASLLAATPTAFANDWSSLGLDGARGRSTDEKSGVPFSPAWNANPSGGPFVASPAVVDGLLVVAGTQGDVTALHAVDGSSAWTVQAAGAVGASPTIDSGHIYFPTLSGNLQALHLGTGVEAWRQAFGGQNYGSPLVVNDTLGSSLVLAAGFPSQKVVRVSAATGVTQWATARDAIADLVSSSPALGTGQVMFGMNGGRYQSLDVLTGTTTWKADAKGAVGLSAPLVVGTNAYFLPGGLTTALYAANAATGELLAGWPVQVGDPSAPAATDYGYSRHVVSSPAAMGDLVVFVARFEYDLHAQPSGAPGLHLLREYLVAVDPKTATVAWQQEIGRKDAASTNDIPELSVSPTPASFATDSAPLVIAASSLSPQVHVFDLGGKEVWSAGLSAPTRSSPVFANGLLIVATDTGVVNAFSSDVNHAPLPPTDGFVPADGAMVDGPAPTLKWAAAQDKEGQALKYQVRVVAAGSDFRESSMAQLDTDAGATSVTLASGLLTPGATYGYVVRARDSLGAWSDWSVPHTFVVAIKAKIDVAGKEYGSLDDAIAALPSTGGVINLGLGVVHLQSSLQLPAGVTLSGKSPNDTVIDATGLKSGVEMTSANHTGAPALKNLTVVGAEVGVNVVDVKNAVLRNVVVRDNKKAGVQVEEGAAAEAINVTLARDGSGAVVSGTFNIHSSLVVSNDVGLAQTGSGTITSRYNNLFGNKTIDYQGVVAAGTGDLAVAVAFKSEADFHVAGFQPTTDHGDPADAFTLEPQPNGARVNMGAFGNTATAELSQVVPSSADGPKTSVPATPVATTTPTSPGAKEAPGGGGSGCSVGGLAGAGSSSRSLWLFAAVGAVLAARRRRR